MKIIKNMISSMMFVSIINMPHMAFANIIEVYGVDESVSKDMLHKYAEKVNQIEEQLYKNRDKPFTKKQIRYRDGLMAKIKQDYHLLYVNFESIYHESSKHHNTVIEVISKDNPERVRFVSPYPRIAYVAEKNDLIDQMIAFKSMAQQSMHYQSASLTEKDCPVYFCFGKAFQKPNLSPYLERFNQGVIKEKALILQTLANDPWPLRREAAVYLLAHLTNPQDIIHTLWPYLVDKSDRVRESAGLVLSATLVRAHKPLPDMKPLIELLSSPYAFDRNQAMMLLSLAPKHELQSERFIQQAGQRLVSLLHLNQMDNHNNAYALLKKMSGKNFSDHDVMAWNNWLADYQIGPVA